MIILDRFEYKTLEKITYPSGARHYLCPDTGRKLPSVTTILDRTAGEKKELVEWRKRVGDKEADRIKTEALGLGTLMHTHLEHYMHGTPRPGGNNTVRILAEKMADQVIEHGLVNTSEVWGNEIHLHCSGLYAGTCDGVGIHRGAESILDFKTAKKLRTKDMINDYFLQVVAYAVCFNELYNTNISTGVIFMVDRDFNFKEFIVEGDEFEAKKSEWFDRLDMFIKLKDFRYEN
jgi:hypothetical protein